MSDPVETKTPLEEIVVKCSECGSKCRGDELNSDIERYYSTELKTFVKLPPSGVSEALQLRLNKLYLLCEICHEKDS